MRKLVGNGQGLFALWLGEIQNMSVLKLILGFIVGSIACGILLALISLKTPILAGGVPAVSKKMDVAQAEISQSGEQKVNTDDTAIVENTKVENIPKTSEPEAPDDVVDVPAENAVMDQGANPQVELDEPADEADEPADEVEVELEEEPTTQTTTSLFKKAGNTLTLGSGSSRLPSVSDEPSVVQDEQSPTEVLSGFASNANAFYKGEGPILSIILIDVGATGVPQAEMLKQSLPLTFAVNGARSDAGFVTADYRDAGFEVVALLNGTEVTELASGEQAAALVRATLNNIPDAVAFVDDPAASLQKNRRLFSAVLEDVAETGHGVLGYKGGLSSMGQAALDMGLPHGLINRYLDAELTDSNSIGRAIDRATIDAAKDGAAILLATASPEVLKGITDWSNSNGSAKVTLVSVSSAIKRLSR
jgi:polysaccharide deacetylase 2 family uncharacterized protein YibQ